MKNIVLIMAMKEEAMPLIESFSFEKSNLPLKRNSSQEYYQSKAISSLSLLINGSWAINSEVSRVGLQVATESAFIAGEILGADWIINAGTAGGVSSLGAEIGDIYIGEKSYYHDRRIPISPDWESFAGGGFTLHSEQSWPALYDFKFGNISSGNSLDLIPHELNTMKKTNCMIKEMELAAIAEYGSYAKVPVTGIKSVTDIIDRDAPSVEEFLSNLNIASKKLSYFLEKFLGNH